MSNLAQQFQDITIDKVFKPVPAEDMTDYYFLPIILTDVPSGLASYGRFSLRIQRSRRARS